MSSHATPHKPRNVQKSIEQPPAVQCEGKQRFLSQNMAAKALRRQGHNMHCYQCPHCQGWHIANNTNIGAYRKRARK